MLNLDEVMNVVGRFAAMKFYPSGNPEVAIAVAEELAERSHDIEEIRWTVKRVVKLYPEWPGINEVRAVYCSRWRPFDGVEAFSSNPRFCDGIPSEREHVPMLEAPRNPEIEPEFASVAGLLGAAGARAR